MSTQIQFRRGSTAQNAAFTGALGEMIIDTTLKVPVVHDGSTLGGFTAVGATATQTLTNKTLTSPIISANTTISGTFIPSANTSYDLGNSTAYFGNFYSTAAYHNTATIASAATSTSTSTGALIVTGGAGLGGNLYLAGNIVGSSSGAWTVPVGTSAQRPGAATNGMIRYNSSITSFEGYYAGAWSSLGGVKSVDGKAYIQAETSAGAGDDVIRVYAGDSGTSTQVFWASSSNVSPASNASINLGGTANYWNNAYVSALTATGITVNSGKILPGANLTVDIGSTTAWFNVIYGNTFQGRSTTASYADLAENYTSDAAYAPATVVVFGGDMEVTITNVSHDTRVAGVVSTNPAYLMNSETAGLPVALTGRVPCLVKGPVDKGAVLVTSATTGAAEALDNSLWKPGCVLGKALESINNNETKIIEIVVGRF